MKKLTSTMKRELSQSESPTITHTHLTTPPSKGKANGVVKRKSSPKRKKSNKNKVVITSSFSFQENSEDLQRNGSVTKEQEPKV